MGIRKAHGTGAKALVRIETLPADELPIGVPSNAQASSPTDFDSRGKFAQGNKISSRGGRARAGKTRLADRLGLQNMPDGAEFTPYKKAAVSFRRAQCAALATNVGGGECGVAPSSIIASAALALAWSRYFSDLAAKTGDPEFAIKALKFGDASRQALLTAHELCAKEAQARAKAVKPKSSSELLE